MEKKEEKQKDNRFTYSDDSGLKVLTEQDILDSLDKKDESIQKSEQNEIKGGKADHLSISDIANKHQVDIKVIKDQLSMGIKVEMEHTDDPNKAIEIAMDHLIESPEYYTKLQEMEESFENKDKGE